MPVGAQKQLNFIEGTNITLGIVDDTVNSQIDITISASSSGGGGAIVDTDSYGAPQTVAGSGALTFPIDQRARIYVASTGGAVTGVTVPAVGTGTKEVYIQFTSDTDTVQLVSGANLLLAGTIVGKAGTLLVLIETPGLGKFVEVSRNEI